MLTKQQAFDTVATHLFTQGERSITAGGSCRYRLAGGMKCAIGALIPDDEYCQDFEGTRAEFIVTRVPALAGLTGDFLNALQGIHDNASSWLSVQDMKAALRSVARRFHVKVSLLADLSFNRAA